MARSLKKGPFADEHLLKKVDALNARSISVTQEHAGIGLFNVQKRICSLYTGSEVTVESIENKGTTVTICIRS